MRRHTVARGITCALLAGGLLCVSFPQSTAQAQTQTRNESQAQKLTRDWQLVTLRLDHKSVDESYLNAWYDFEDNTFYVSLQDLFEAVKIEIATDRSGHVLSGFYLDETNTYRIDAAEKTVTVGSDRFSIKPEDIVERPLGLFFHPEALSRWFGFTLTADMRALAAHLKSEVTMPITLAQQRARQRRWLMRAGAIDQELLPPLMYERQQRAIAGGLMAYDVGAAFGAGDTRYNVRIAGAMELLASDFETSFRLNGTGTDMGLEFQRIRWRYVPPPKARAYARQIMVGALSSAGLRNFRYYGLRLDNQPVRFRKLYGRYQLSGQTEPGWEVELYLNDRLIDYQQADAGGRYEFSIPLSYGSTLATIRSYGPSGQSHVVERRVQVPFTFVPRGETYYSLDMGRTIQNDYSLGQFAVAVGLTNWLTNRTGVEYLSPLAGHASRSPWRMYNSISARAGHYLMSLDVAPSVSYGASIRAYYPSLTSFEASYNWYEDESLYNPLGIQSQFTFRANAPWHLGVAPVNLRFLGRRQFLTAGHVRYSLRPGVLTQLGGVLRISNDLNIALEQPPGADMKWSQVRSDTRFTYAVGRSKDNPLLLRGMLLSGAFGVNLRQEHLETIQLTASRDIFGWGRAYFQVLHNLITGYSNVGVNLVLDLPTVRTRTSMRWSPAGTYFSQNAGGSVAFDPHSRNLVMERSSRIGQSAVSMRMFVDYNGNDQYDEGEHVLDDAELRFWQATQTRRSPEGIIYAHNLRPYTRYNVLINKESIKNPLWVPKADSFGLVTDPNRMKTIDIPFYAAGVVTGSALREQEGATYPLPGLRVHVMDLDGDFEATLPVFTDGSFYKMGIPPGEYRARIDPSQLRILNLESEPATQTFVVEVTRDGDIVDGVDFRLIDRSPQKQRAPAPAIAGRTRTSHEGEADNVRQKGDGGDTKPGTRPADKSTFDTSDEKPGANKRRTDAGPAAIRRMNGPIAPEKGGYSIIVLSGPNARKVDRLSNNYNLQLDGAALPVTVLQGTVDGRQWYRIAAGQFPTIAEAEKARARLFGQLPADAWLVRLSEDMTVRRAASVDQPRTIEPSAGGYSIIVLSGQRERVAERLAVAYRIDWGGVKLPIRVLRGEVDGTYWYRIAAGQFDTLKQARRALSELSDRLPPKAWLLPLEEGM